jgi:class 3 adenylate cyclase
MLDVITELCANLDRCLSHLHIAVSGFTKWSSERSPHEVFKLLERLFWEFDDIAQRLHVFKLGTIGDCYIAVTGIPDPIDDHATLLTQFAFECRTKVRKVCSDLEAEGLDTAKLDMRFGIHSGAITAGILRGTKSRFELFGDTINTASRMESTGQAGKIQLSEETAELLRMDNKGSWLKKREDKVAAKGKGTLQTYWAEPMDKRISFHDSGVMDNLTAENLKNLESSNDIEKVEEDVETGKVNGAKNKADPLDNYIPKDEIDEERSIDESC